MNSTGKSSSSKENENPNDLFFEEPSVPLINNFAEVVKMYNEKTLTFNKAAIMAGMNRYSFKKLIL